MTDARKIERAIVDYLLRQGIRVSDTGTLTISSYAGGGIKIDTRRMAEAIADEVG